MVKLFDLNKVVEESDEVTPALQEHTPPTHNVQIVSPSRNLVMMSTPVRRKLILESPSASPSVPVQETPSNFKIPPQIPSNCTFGQQILPDTTPSLHTTSPRSVPNSQDCVPPKKRKIQTPISTNQHLSTGDSSRKSMAVDDQSITTPPESKTISSSIILNSPLTPPTVTKSSLMAQQVSSLDKNLGLYDPATGKNRFIEPMYKWACSERCKVQSLAFLKSNNITKVSLEVKCMACRKKCKMWLNLDVELKKTIILLSTHKSEVPVAYVSEKTNKCPMCKVKTVMEPVQAKNKRNTNWLGLLLAHELNSLNFDRLVYFCRQRGLKWRDNCSKARLMRLCMGDLVDQLGVNAPQGTIC